MRCQLRQRIDDTSPLTWFNYFVTMTSANEYPRKSIRCFSLLTSRIWIRIRLVLSLNTYRVPSNIISSCIHWSKRFKLVDFCCIGLLIWHFYDISINLYRYCRSIKEALLVKRTKSAFLLVWYRRQSIGLPCSRQIL